MDTQNFLDDKYIKLALTLKTNQLKREQLSSLTYQLVERALVGKWKYEKIDTLHDAVNDIFNLTANEVVAYLSNEAIIMGSRMKINDFQDLFGGEEK